MPNKKPMNMITQKISDFGKDAGFFLSCLVCITLLRPPIEKFIRAPKSVITALALAESN